MNFTSINDAAGAKSFWLWIASFDYRLWWNRCLMVAAKIHGYWFHSYRTVYCPPGADGTSSRPNSDLKPREQIVAVDKRRRIVVIADDIKASFAGNKSVGTFRFALHFVSIYRNGSGTESGSGLDVCGNISVSFKRWKATIKMDAVSLRNPGDERTDDVTTNRAQRTLLTYVTDVI